MTNTRATPLIEIDCLSPALAPDGSQANSEQPNAEATLIQTPVQGNKERIALRFYPVLHVAVIDASETHRSLFRFGKVRDVRFSTLEKLCAVLDCQPGDLLVYDPDPGYLAGGDGNVDRGSRAHKNNRSLPPDVISRHTSRQTHLAALQRRSLVNAAIRSH